jgi:hypothetical protein
MKTLRLFLVTAFVGLITPLFGQGAAGKTEIPNAAQPQLTVGSDGRVWLVYAQNAATPAAAAGGHDHHKAAPAENKGHEAKSHDAKGHEAKGHKKGGHGPAGRAGDVFVASSKDGGATFGAPIKVAHVPQLMVGNRRGPRIAANGDRITVTLIAHELVAFTSTDGGATWSGPVTINDVPNSAHEGLHDLAGSRSGELFVTWLDLRNGKTELWGATSKDAGRRWAKNELVYKSPDKSICECCHPSALFDADGNLAVMWRNSIEGSRDMWLTTRAKGASQFTSARKLGEGTWKINGCPHDGGTIVALGGGKFGAVWQREGQVYLIRADGAEVALGKGRQPAAAATDKGPLVIWNDGTQLVASGEALRTPPKTKFSEGRFPSLAALPGGKGAVLAYEVGAKGIAVERL